VATYSDPTTIIPTGNPKAVELGPLLAIVAAVISVISVGFMFYMSYSTNAAVTTENQVVAKKQADLTKLKTVSDQATTYSTQATALHTIFDNQIRWNTAIVNLQTHLYKNMALTSLQLDDGANFSMKGYAPDYVSYAKLYRSLTDAEGAKYYINVKPVSVQKVTDKDTGVTTVQFTISMKLTKDIMGIVPITPVTGAITK
jgi:hypothetical protein